GNWDNGAPTSSSNACILLNGTYTVTLHDSVTVSTLTIGGGSGTQTLDVQSGDPGNINAALTASNGVTNNATGQIVLDCPACHTNTGSLTVGSGTLQNSGTISTKDLSTAHLAGALTNNGTLQIGTSSDYGGSSSTLLNQGMINLSAGVSFTTSQTV